MTGRDVHRSGTFVLSALMVVIGLALIVQVVGGHGSAISARLIIGVLFLVAGVARLYLERKRDREA